MNTNNNIPDRFLIEYQPEILVEEIIRLREAIRSHRDGEVDSEHLYNFLPEYIEYKKFINVSELRKNWAKIQEV